MLGYHAPDVAIDVAKGHPRFARLLPFGPWSYKAHPAGGTLAFWSGAPLPLVPGLECFGTPRPCIDGLVFYPPKALPSCEQLAKPAAGRDDCTTVQLACGATLCIRPAYLEPRKILSTGQLGDPVTRYGLIARKVLGRLTDKANDRVTVFDPDILELARLAIANTYRAPAELIDDLGWLTEHDIDPLAEAAFGGPKAEPASA